MPALNKKHYLRTCCREIKGQQECQIKVTTINHTVDDGSLNQEGDDEGKMKWSDLGSILVIEQIEYTYYLDAILLLFTDMQMLDRIC